LLYIFNSKKLKQKLYANTFNVLRFVQAWIEIHKDELLANWTLCQAGEEPYKINPLN